MTKTNSLCKRCAAVIATKRVLPLVARVGSRIALFLVAALCLPTPKAFPQSCALTPGITAYWTADGNAVDLIANHRGTLHGGVSFVPGVIGQAFDFDGSTGFVEVPSAAALEPASAISIAAWVNPTSFGNPAGEIASKYDSSHPGAGGSWALEVLSTGQVVLDILGPSSESAISAETTMPLTLGNWQHVAATFDTATQAIAVYINGVMQETTCYNGDCGTVTSIEQSTASVLIGAYDAGTAAFWSGFIDDVQVFRVALTPAQVAAIYQNGVCPPAWRATHRYFKGNEVHDPAWHVQVVITGGTSGPTVPDWNDSGGTTTDGTVIWKDRGLEP